MVAMARISEAMARDHKSCDERFAVAEAAVADGDLARAVAELAVFAAALERHFRAEEEQLFPAFEQATGITDGPTEMMRIEHAEMREVLEGLRSVLEAGDSNEFLGLAETLNVLLQQHNLKEEQVLYALFDEALPGVADELLASLHAA
jgi:hemerythrin-like domain-containing protein